MDMFVWDGAPDPLGGLIYVWMPESKITFIKRQLAMGVSRARVLTLVVDMETTRGPFAGKLFCLEPSDIGYSNEPGPTNIEKYTMYDGGDFLQGPFFGL
jgi:hypothetical protein